MIDPQDFRRVVGHFAAGVAVVTTRRPDGSPTGLTASAVTSVSLRPTLLLVCVDRGSETHAHILRSGVFAVNVLAEDTGPPLARVFSTSSRLADKFAGVEHREGATGAPLLQAALAWLECRLRHAHEGGDHTIFVGEVEAADEREGRPLVYYRGGLGGLAR